MIFKISISSYLSHSFSVCKRSFKKYQFRALSVCSLMFDPFVKSYLGLLWCTSTDLLRNAESLKRMAPHSNSSLNTAIQRKSGKRNKSKSYGRAKVRTYLEVLDKSPTSLGWRPCALSGWERRHWRVPRHAPGTTGQLSLQILQEGRAGAELRHRKIKE